MDAVDIRSSKQLSPTSHGKERASGFILRMILEPFTKPSFTLAQSGCGFNYGQTAYDNRHGRKRSMAASTMPSRCAASASGPSLRFGMRADKLI